MKKIITVLIIFSALLISAHHVHADETCDQDGETCCTAGSLYFCDNNDLACNREQNPNDDPNKQYDSYIFICRKKTDVVDTTTCDQIGEKCCQTISTITTPFCVNNLTCDANKLYTCQLPPNLNIDYTKCSLSGNACCHGAIPGCGIGGCNYCGPGLTMHESPTSCKCCTPGDDNCTPNSNTVPSFEICDTVKDAAQNKLCTDCLADNGVWTGIGCIHFNPKGFVTDFLKIAMGVAGGIALLLMVYGSFLISTSAGDPKKSEEGKEIITGTIAGLLFIIFSVVILNFIGVQIINIPGL